MVSSIDNDQPQKCVFIVTPTTTATTHKRQRQRRTINSNSSTCNTSKSSSRSIFSKFTMWTAVYALLYCTSHQDVVAYSETKVMMESHSDYYLSETLEQEQIMQPIRQSSSLEDTRGTEVQQHKYMLDLDTPTNLLGDHPYKYSSDHSKRRRRRMQRRGVDTIPASASSTAGSNNNMGYDVYGVPPTSNNIASAETNSNNVGSKEDSSSTGGWFNFGKKDKTDTNSGNSANENTNESNGNSAYGSYYGSGNGASSQASTSGSAYGNYGSAAAAGSSSGGNTGYGSYGSSPSSSAYGGSTSAYGASSTSAYGGGTSPRSSSSYYGGSSYSSTWGAGSASSTSHQWGSNSLRGGGGKRLHSVKIDLLKAIFFLLLICTTGMLLTAHSMEHHPEGTLANCCRVSLHTVNCVYSIFFNLYHCRLGELPGIIECGGSELEEGEYTEEELERMTLRPGIERALDTEHRKALRKVGVEMNMIKPKNGSGGGRKSNGVRNGASISR